MSFDEQVKWIESKIEELRSKKRELLSEEFESEMAKELQLEVSNEIQSEVNALATILNDYKKAQADSVNLGWVRSPDLMGRY